MHEFIRIGFLWILEHTDLPEHDISGSNSALGILFDNEFLQVVDVGVGRCRDLEGYRFAVDETPKRTRCDLRHGGRRQVLQLDSVSDSEDTVTSNEDPNNFFKPLQLGGVAHELGSIPMRGSNKNTPYCLNDHLSLYKHKRCLRLRLVCLPILARSQSHLTLAALALRLSRTILPRLPYVETCEDVVYLMNQTGETIQVFLSNRAGVAIDRIFEV